MKNLAKKTMAIAAAALCLGAATRAFADSTGDVWSIMPCDASGVTATNRFESLSWVTNSNGGIEVENPIPVKETVYFRLRLWNHAVTNSAGQYRFLPWKQTYTDPRLSTYDEKQIASDWAANRPQIGIFAAGSDTPTYATLVDIYNSTNRNAGYEHFTDLVFEYVVQPGDFALPIDIAVKDTISGNPVPNYKGSGLSFYFNPDRTMWTFKPWDYENGTFLDESIVWTGGLPANTIPSAIRNKWDNSDKQIEGGSSTRNFGTSSDGFINIAKFYVQTVRFATKDADGNVTPDFAGYSVPMASTKTVGLLAADNTLDTAREFYVWSDNESVVTLAPSTSVTVEKIEVDSKNKVTNSVARVTLTGDTATFAITGVDTNGTANLVLSATPHYNYMKNGVTLMSDFVTIPVTVTEPEPAALVVSADSAPVATGDRAPWTGTRLKVALTYNLPEDAPNDLSVQLTPSITGITNSLSGVWSNYVFFATTETYTGATPPSDFGASVLSGIIKKGTSSLASAESGTAKDIYVYALCSEAQGSILNVAPSITAGDDNNFVGTRWTAYSGKITTSVEATLQNELSPVKNRPTELEIYVSDAYADENVGLATGGYKLEYYLDKAERDTKVTIPNLYRNASGILVTDLTANTLPSVTYTSTSQTASSFVVTSPLGNKASAAASVDIEEVSDDDVRAEITAGANEDGTVTEGSAATVVLRYRNFEGDYQQLYAYLVCLGDPNVESTMFSNSTGFDIVVCNDNAAAAPTGYPVTGGTTASAAWQLTPLTSVTADFRVVFCTTPTWDSTAIYEGAPSSVFRVVSTNVSATVNGMWMYMGTTYSDPEDKDDDGDGTFAETLLYDQKRYFRARVSDAEYDRANGMVVKWTVRREGRNKDESIVFDDATGATVTNSAYRVVTGTGAAIAPLSGWVITGPGVSVDDSASWFPFTFTGAGTYTVTAEVWDAFDYPGRDKEEEDDKRGAIVAKKVNVTGLSAVTVTTSFTDANGDNLLLENTTVQPTITVELQDWTDERMIQVELAVAPKSATDANVGMLGMPNDNWVSNSTDGVTHYYVKNFNVGSYEPWVIELEMDELDGVANSATATKGWDVTARVITTENLASKNKPACDYYTPGKLARPIKILNVAPQVDSAIMPIDAETSTYTNLSKDAASIEWGTKDVEADLNAMWTNRWYGGAKADLNGDYPTGTGVLVVVRGENVQVTNFFANGATYGQYEPVFIDDQSAATVYIDFYDKDRAKSSISAGPYIYPAQPTKMLRTVANMPSGGNSAIPLSSIYASAKGVGYGHTWLYEGAKKFISAQSFGLSWNCGTANSTETVYAFGYRANDNDRIDNGELDKIDGEYYDIWVGPMGNHKRNAATPTTDDGFYKYIDSLYDSFVYGWISATEPGGSEYKFSANPQIGTNDVKWFQVALPVDKSDDGGFVATYLEAVFSREYNQYDQMGDINDDGIPDYYMLYPNWTGGALVTADGSADLASISALNGDNDFYPASPHLGLSTISPGAVSGWETSGQPFTTMAEIRGYHEGLNFGMFQYAQDERTTYRGREIVDGFGTEWVSELHLSDLEKKSLMRRVLNRRDYLLNKLYTGTLVVTSTDDEPKELELVTNLLNQVYYRGAANGSGDIMFRIDAGTIYAATNAYEKTDIDEDTGLEYTHEPMGWTRVFRPYGTTAADDATVVTNFIADAISNEVTGVMHYPNPCDAYSLDEVDFGNWLNRENNPKFLEQQMTAKSFINYTWRHVNQDRTNWGWTCENRTDPNSDDTDGDTMPDGYEYYMWYSAVIGPGTNQLTGCRFNLADIESYDDVITSDEIAKLYNPNLPADWTRRDTDNDGIYDKEEFLIGTSPVHWDTDRDGLSDLYEVMYNINPLSDGQDNNGAANGDGDFMAVCSCESIDELNEYQYIYQATNGTYWALNIEYDRFGYISTNKNVMNFSTEFVRASGGAPSEVLRGFEVKPFNGGWILPTEDTRPAYLAARKLTVFTIDDEIAGAFHRIGNLEFNPKFGFVTNNITLYHHQVHNYFGFDPRTGWNKLSSGKVAGRWGGSEAGTSINTGAFTATDEFRLLKYRYIVGLRNLSDDQNKLKEGKTTIASIIGAGTTNPSANFEEKSWGDDETKYAQTRHGADTDGDSVPDGWELYIGVNPNIDFTIPETSPNCDALYHKGNNVWPGSLEKLYSDGLNLAREYSGTDSCRCYAACESIYKYYPGNQYTGNFKNPHYQWFNKFFPTDPRNDDTDGDGIPDRSERAKSWSGFFVFNRFGQTISCSAWHHAIYGDPSDDGTSLYRSGGGMNPCSIDTDLDGLPDPWEWQYAGVLCYEDHVVDSVLGDREEDGDDDDEVLETFPSGLPYNDIYDDLRAALESYWWTRQSNYNHRYYIAMGMDPTTPDASSSNTYAEDCDWDGDGLQNWQEYMVQVMRHFRYDDPWSPLLGRDCPAVQTIGLGSVITPGGWNGDTKGYLRTSYMEPFTSDDAEKLTNAGYPNFAQAVIDNPDYHELLGYFIDPPREWDIARLRGMKYMLPPTAVTYTIIDGSRPEQETDVDGNLLWETKGGTVLASNQWDENNGIYSIRYARPGTTNLVSVVVTPKTRIVSTKRARRYNYLSDNYKYRKYVGTDPRLWDTDMDGMDDYYELFHGLNPILGQRNGTASYYDVIAEAHSGHVTPTRNAWVGWDNTDAPAYDPIRFPWLMGVADCDADGDGLRNYEEALSANVTNPNASHTDPTPMWMTDPTVEHLDPLVSGETKVEVVYARDSNGEILWDFDTWAPYISEVVTNQVTNAVNIVAASPSYTALYYVNEIQSPLAPASEYGIEPYESMRTAWFGYSSAYSDTHKYIASFEVNEGYDTDNDWRTDSGEIKSLSRKNSDPLDFNDPARRQSVWFGGKSDPGALIAFQPTLRNMNGSDFFKQFTVEAWIKPDASANGQDQYIVSRASRYGYWDLESWNEYNGSSNAVIRMNFALGVDASGCIFAETQNASELTSRVTGEKANDGEWVHIAATYDGKALRLYRNGELETSAATTLIPANGTTSVLQNPQGQRSYPYAMYRVVPSITIIGGRACGDGAFHYTYASNATGWDDVATDFFKGSVTEVRTWDGARTGDEIASAYNTSFSIDDLKAQRDAYFAAWADGARRVYGNLPVELVQYYNMSTLPGATDASFVRLEPTGFQENVVGSARNPENESQTLGDSLKVGWWSKLLASPVASKVYTSGYVVPWVQNMVGHLPKLCGSVADSVYWSEHYAGYTPASFQDLSAFSFPNSMNPYNTTVTSLEDSYLYNKYTSILWHDSGVEYDEDTTTITNSSSVITQYLKFRYDYRLGIDGVSDLLPVGSAYAKRSETYWDGQGAETVWQETGTDLNANDLPDWWEAYAIANYGVSSTLTPDTEVTRKGVKMSAYEAYIRDLAAGMLPTKTTIEAFANNEDFDKNGLPDWWTEIYGVKGAAEDDDDNDGLSNYTELMLSEYFDLETSAGAKVTFNPTKAKSNSLYDSDYFFKIGQLYTGEIFTDHDFMEDVWEDERGADYVNRYAWDSNLDPDSNGWSNYAERRAKDDMATWVQYATETNSAVLVFDIGSPEYGIWMATNTATIALEELYTEYSGWVAIGGTGHDGGSGWVGYPSQMRYTIITETPIMGYSGRPKPNISLKLWYNKDQPMTASSGDNSSSSSSSSSDDKTAAVAYAQIVVQTFTRQNVVAPDATFMVTPTENLGLQPITFTLSTPDSGFVKEGENTLVAFVDLDGDGKYTAGEPMGTTKLDIGWHQGVAELELTDTSPIITRVDLLAESDRSALYGTDSGDITPAAVGELSGGKVERVRVIRTLVNGEDQVSLDMENRIIFDKEINLDQRSFLFEGDVLADGSFDIDWDHFQSEVMGKIDDPLAVTYRIVLGNGTIDPTETNNLYSVATVRHFDSNASRTRPVVVSPGSIGANVVGTRPIFKWTMKATYPDAKTVFDNNSYTAFQVQVLDGTKVVYDSEIRRAPARDLNGVYSFVPDVYVGDLLEPDKNYKWHVSMYNSKFRSAFWSDGISNSAANTFRVSAMTNSLGTIKVAARYFGPAKVLSNGEVRIEAFTTPDFTGDPVARTYVRPSEKSSVGASDTEHVVNATLIGLGPGTYYVRGYVDLNSYGENRKKDSWESWGYVCKRDGDSSDIFTPITIVIDDTLGAGEVFDLYIEDVDTNGNFLPDAWEMVENRGKLDNGTAKIDDTLDSGISINRTLSDNLQKKQTSSAVAAGLAAHVFQVMKTSGIAALALNADTDSHSSLTIAAASAVGGVSTVTTAEEVKVDAIEATDNTVTLVISLEATVGQDEASADAGSTRGVISGKATGLYQSNGSSDESEEGVLECTVLMSTDLVNWEPVETPVRVKVSAGNKVVIESLNLSKPSDPSGKPLENCFFKVEVAN